MGNNRIAGLIPRLSLEGVEESVVRTDRRYPPMFPHDFLSQCVIMYNNDS